MMLEPGCQIQACQVLERVRTGDDKIFWVCVVDVCLGALAGERGKGREEWTKRVGGGWSLYDARSGGAAEDWSERGAKTRAER